MRTKVGIIGAMEVEVELLHNNMDELRSYRIAGLELWEGLLGSTDVCVVRSGIGKVNAALAAELLIERFQVSHVINTGVAGKLSARFAPELSSEPAFGSTREPAPELMPKPVPELSIGDLVVSKDCVHHDVDATVIGYEPGQIPAMPSYAFEADENLRRLAVHAAQELAPEQKVVEGRVASGDQFIGSSAVNARIAQTFNALCCDMEGAAIAQVAWVNQIPFVVVRAISDGANDASHVDYPSFERMAAERCAAIVQHMVAALA